MTSPQAVDKSPDNVENSISPENVSHLAPKSLVRTTAKGGKLRSGNPGNVGGGRPSTAWKQRMAYLAEEGRKALETAKVLQNPEHPLFMPAFKFAAEQAHGQAAKRVEVAGDVDNPLAVSIVVSREA